MDSITKKIFIKEARKIVYELIDNSDSNNNNKVDIIEKFWMIELDKCYLATKDSNTLNRIFELKNDKTEPSITFYNNCIKENVVSYLLKKNWRRLFNNNIIDKYHVYMNRPKIDVSDPEPRTTNHEPRTTKQGSCSTKNNLILEMVYV